MSNSGLDLIVLLLDFTKDNEIVGNLRFHKLLFLLIKEGGFSNFEDEFSFEAYNYGPWSPKLDSHLQMLEDKEIITIESEKADQVTSSKSFTFFNEQDNCREEPTQTFRVKDKGIFIADKLKEKYKKKLINLERIVKVFSNVSNAKLLRYIYTTYPDYTTKSKIKEDIQQMSPEEEFKTAHPDIKIDKSLFSIVGILPKISHDEEKRKIREIIMSRF